MNIARFFRKKPVEIKKDSEFAEVKFDSKYRIVLKLNHDEYVNEKIDWLDKNSIGSIQVKMGEDPSMPWYAPAGLVRTKYQVIYIGFEKEDDATFFRIKYAL